MSVYPRCRLCILITALTLQWATGAPDKLFPNQVAPAHARSSAGRALPLPSGGTPANVNRLPGGGSARPSSPGAGPPQEDGVQREETVSFKEVNGETVQVVVGSYGYESPEGLPVSFKYMADDEGNKASFTIGAAAKGGGGGGGGGGSRPSSGGQKPGGGAGAGTKGGGGGGKGGAGAGGGDRQYLPPS